MTRRLAHLTVAALLAVTTLTTTPATAATPDPQQPGPHPVGYQTLTLTDPARDDRPVKLHITYPAAAPTSSYATLDMTIFTIPTTMHAGATIAPGRFPLIVASHGWRAVGEQSYRQAQHIASHGYIVVWVTHAGSDMTAAVNGTLTGFGPEGFGRDFTDRHWDLDLAKRAALWMHNTSIAWETPGDPWLAYMGHSFGGYAALTMTYGANQPTMGYAYPGDPHTDATIAIAPFTGLAPDPLAFTGPTLLLTSQADTVATPDQAQRTWNSTWSWNKFWIDYQGITHAAPSEVCDFHQAAAVALWNNPTNPLLHTVMTSIHDTAGGACNPDAPDPDLLRRSITGTIVPFLDIHLKHQPAHTWLARARSNTPGRNTPNNYRRCDPRIPTCDTTPS